MELVAGDGGGGSAGGRRAADDDDVTWNLTFAVNNHLVLLTATALFLCYLVASLLLFVWRWRGCLVRLSLYLSIQGGSK